MQAFALRPFQFGRSIKVIVAVLVERDEWIARHTMQSMTPSL